MKYPQTLAATKSPEITALVDGMSVVGNGYFFTQEMLDNMEAALSANNSSQARIDELTQQLADANTATQTAQAALQTANETIAARDTTITGLQGQVTTLESEAGTFQETISSNKPKGKVALAFHEDPETSFNKIADSLMPKRVAKAEDE